jgi:hypothetical protein
MEVQAAGSELAGLEEPPASGNADPELTFPIKGSWAVQPVLNHLLCGMAAPFRLSSMWGSQAASDMLVQRGSSPNYIYFYLFYPYLSILMYFRTTS